MEVKIALFQKGLRATYKIHQIDNTTFNAVLRDFAGDNRPPDYIKFYKSEAGWRSAYEDGELIRELGLAVDNQ